MIIESKTSHNQSIMTRSVLMKTNKITLHNRQNVFSMINYCMKHEQLVFHYQASVKSPKPFSRQM